MFWIVSSVFFSLEFLHIMTYIPSIIIDNCCVYKSFKTLVNSARRMNFAFSVCFYSLPLCKNIFYYLRVSVQTTSWPCICIPHFWVAVRTFTMHMTDILLALICFKVCAKCEYFTTECLLNEGSVCPSSYLDIFQ